MWINLTSHLIQRILLNDRQSQIHSVIRIFLFLFFFLEYWMHSPQAAAASHNFVTKQLVYDVNKIIITGSVHNRTNGEFDFFDVVWIMRQATKRHQRKQQQQQEWEHIFIFVLSFFFFLNSMIICNSNTQHMTDVYLRRHDSLEFARSFIQTSLQCSSFTTKTGPFPFFVAIPNVDQFSSFFWQNQPTVSNQ